MTCNFSWRSFSFKLCNSFNSLLFSPHSPLIMSHVLPQPKTQQQLMSLIASHQGEEFNNEIRRVAAGWNRTLLKPEPWVKTGSLNSGLLDWHHLRGHFSRGSHNALQINKMRSTVEQVMILARKPPSSCTMDFHLYNIKCILKHLLLTYELYSKYSWVKAIFIWHWMKYIVII